MVSKFAWAKLNADGVFIALIIMAAGLFDMFLTEYNPIVAAGKVDEVIFVQARAAGYIASGALLLYSLMASKIRQEVWARFMLLGAMLFQLWRRWLEFHDPLNPAVSSIIVLFTLFSVTSWFRLRVLLAKEGVMFHIPPRKGEE